MLNAPATIGLPAGVYPLTPTPAGRARVGLISQGSVGDTVLVYGSLRALLSGSPYRTIVSGSEVAGPALALFTDTTEGEVTTRTLRAVDGEVLEVTRFRSTPSPYGGVRVEYLPA